MEAGTTSPAIAYRAMNPPERDFDRVAALPPRIIPVRYAVDIPTVFPRRGTTPISPRGCTAGPHGTTRVYVPPPDMFLGNDIHGAVLARSDEVGPVRLLSMPEAMTTTIFGRHHREGASGCGL